MTIAISVKVSEGLVLAADSALTVEGQIAKKGEPPRAGILQVYPHATKVTQIGSWPVGAINWGTGLIGSRTIGSLVDEYSNVLPDVQHVTVEQIAKEVYEFMTERCLGALKEAGGHLGLQIAGFSPGAFFPEQYLLVLPAEQGPDGQGISAVRPNGPDGSPDFGANWYGLTEAIIRLVKGFEPQAIQSLTKAGVSEQIAAKIRQFEYPVVFEAMPLQDAVDVAAWLADVVIGRFRFVVGTPRCVGPVDIATITRQNGFAWVQRKLIRVSLGHPFVG